MTHPKDAHKEATAPIKRLSGDLEARAKRIGAGYLIAVVRVEDSSPAVTRVIERPDDGVDWDRVMRETPQPRTEAKSEGRR